MQNNRHTIKSNRPDTHTSKDPKTSCFVVYSDRFLSVLADAVVLNSLCKMFGLLDSVKQALDLKRCQEEENKIHNGTYGETTTCVMPVCAFQSAGVGKGFTLPSCIFQCWMRFWTSRGSGATLKAPPAG